ncbi:hypothetical protein BGL34_04205 [Fructilactobacillus lindneri]|uniref:LysR substrate-binding domain-containing protein n=2 Tax=Fructilactobacillus lindneri TaxID=53444 RepID=A0A0R2JMP8_9LACO|nr:LysR substrate-binding domain-containing protein [Fructilactobacillus lindneri]KRN78417.1 hypothetical protein IV52_GL001187 [Fructilactobacillus lindneri DSM 20690 = JCM 11027]ANZ57681.1 hypothetical protein AYR60_02335 [Fructilactobacillus lindneri]ANZ58951.1 hypothetical protein AYR59_02335 [Fructilactobacillus lindneri]POG97976.1 hypothetical protein BGL31_04550 [Fructilactobacillus lindneri]POG99030.1 hypothetical protein BGL32_06265 [Fructilactobacillus lindneri]
MIVNKQNHLANKKFVNLQDLDSEKVIQMTDGFIQANVIDNIKNKQFKKLNVVYRTRDPELIEELVQKNIGISLLLSNAIKLRDKIVPIKLNDDKIPQVYISLVWRNGYELNTRLNNLLETIINSIKVSC